MFESLGARHGDNDAQICADVLENAISKHLSSGAPVTYDLGGSASTSMVGDAIAEKCKEILQEMGS